MLGWMSLSGKPVWVRPSPASIEAITQRDRAAPLTVHGKCYNKGECCSLDGIRVQGLVRKRTASEAGWRQVALLDVADRDGHPRPPLRPVPHALAELLDRAVQVHVRRLRPLVRVVRRRLRTSRGLNLINLNLEILRIEFQVINSIQAESRNVDPVPLPATLHRKPPPCLLDFWNAWTAALQTNVGQPRGGPKAARHYPHH